MDSTRAQATNGHSATDMSKRSGPGSGPDTHHKDVVRTLCLYTPLLHMPQEAVLAVVLTLIARMWSGHSACTRNLYSTMHYKHHFYNYHEIMLGSRLKARSQIQFSTLNQRPYSFRPSLCPLPPGGKVMGFSITLFWGEPSPSPQNGH